VGSLSGLVVPEASRAAIREAARKYQEADAIPKDKFPGDKGLHQLNLIGYLGGYTLQLLDALEALEARCNCGEANPSDDAEAVSIRRELLLALSREWASTPDLARMVGVPKFGNITPIRDALYVLRGEGRVELRRRGGLHGFLWRLSSSEATQ